MYDHDKVDGGVMSDTSIKVGLAAMAVLILVAVTAPFFHTDMTPTNNEPAYRAECFAGDDVVDGAKEVIGHPSAMVDC